MPEQEAIARFELLRELYDLSMLQRRCIEQDRIEEVVDLMDRRDALLVQLRDVVADAGAGAANLIAFPSSAVSDEYEQNEIAIDALIRGILDSDRENERLLMERMGEIRTQLPALRRGRAATHQYRAQGPQRGYIDLVS